MTLKSNRSNYKRKQSHTNKSNVCVIGTWHLGCVTASCLADSGYKVIGFDHDQTIIDNLNRGIPPLFEPELQNLINKNIASNNLSFTTDIKAAIQHSSVIIITIDTPVGNDDEANLTPILNTCAEIAVYLQNNSLIIVSSQVPVGTCERLASLITQSNPNVLYEIVCVPENIKLGEGIQRFKNPDMIIIGSANDNAKEKANMFYELFDCPKLNMTLRAAEMTKHALNSFVGTCISYANELAGLCDNLGIDTFTVVNALKLDERVSKKAPLAPGLGFSGGTVARDLQYLSKLGRQCQLPMHVVNAVLQVNHLQNKVVITKLKGVYPSLENKKICVLGLTYKANTSSLRRSLALELIQDLSLEKADVYAHDPKANLGEVKKNISFKFFDDPYRAAEGADALVILTEWPEFLTLDYSRMKKIMKKPIIIDAKNILDEKLIRKQDFIYYGIGRGK